MEKLSAKKEELEKEFAVLSGERTTVATRLLEIDNRMREIKAQHDLILSVLPPEAKTTDIKAD